jgi:hypothetical protein
MAELELEADPALEFSALDHLLTEAEFDADPELELEGLTDGAAAEVGGSLEAQLEHDRPKPKMSKSFSSTALAQLPSVIAAKPLACLEVVVAMRRVLWLIGLALKQPEPHWAKSLMVTPDEFIRLFPKVTMQVDLFQTVPTHGSSPQARKAFEAYVKLVSATPLYVFGFGTSVARANVERKLDVSLDQLFATAGLPRSFKYKFWTLDALARHVLVIYAPMPPGVVKVIEDQTHRVLPDFAFDKADLKPEHKQALDQMVRFIYDTWRSTNKAKPIELAHAPTTSGWRGAAHSLPRSTSRLR